MNEKHLRERMAANDTRIIVEDSRTNTSFAG